MHGHGEIGRSTIPARGENKKRKRTGMARACGEVTGGGGGKTRGGVCSDRMAIVIPGGANLNGFYVT